MFSPVDMQAIVIYYVYTLYIKWLRQLLQAG